jgi:predicted AAA+ superfamily ATPase
MELILCFRNRPLSDAEWQALWEHGGFPEPFLRRDVRFTRRWRSLRHDQLTHEDIRDVTQIETLGLLETLTDILAELSGQRLIYSSLANEVGIAVDTVKRWIDLLERLHFGFVVRLCGGRINERPQREARVRWSAVQRLRY